jgi:hypothetical protein
LRGTGAEEGPNGSAQLALAGANCRHPIASPLWVKIVPPWRIRAQVESTVCLLYCALAVLLHLAYHVLILILDYEPVHSSTLKPELDAHGVALAGIGLEELGLEEFLAGNYFNGDLYLDVDKSCYKVGVMVLSGYCCISSLNLHSTSYLGPESTKTWLRKKCLPPRFTLAVDLHGSALVIRCIL